MHQAAYRWVEQQVAAHGPFARVVEIGAKNINGSVRPLFGHAIYLGIDVVDGPGVDVVADGATYEPQFAPACVTCCEVLEHTPNAAAIVANARAMLAEGGTLILTAAGAGRAGHSAVDGGFLRSFEFYQNVDVTNLTNWLDGMADVVVTYNPEAKDVYAVARKA